MAKDSPRFQLHSLGDSALLITALPTDDVDWVFLGECLRARPEYLDAVPAYHSLTLHLASEVTEPEATVTSALEQALTALDKKEKRAEPNRSAPVELPVCYHPSLAPDLEAVARHTGLTTEEVIRRHTAPLYQVRFLGFAPGFPFLTGLDPSLATPRHRTPRIQVEAGSVGIAGEQTGIYPNASPGGWQLIGRCPLPLVDFDQRPPTRLQPGDSLRFVPITLAQFEQLAREAP
ncbi:5-oxoprolinase subunit PxpB [Ferrimonas balearica]|uniref:5-oxoprolinase subunit PxpB n=1 Tax=Ferrimonas balearica TaxID=44012 RepID=UPI001C99DABE|nr:5-oxoprolinase subunit PxpB [Ferrimonas balearica]MBY5921122.1 5-oxoprolinase subunit PxpB [Ferrimonas balearica]MBY5996193.1 5-oxoprolinase subunit PxpB [Ferrimonas balearica]